MQLVAADICNNNPVTLEGDKTLYNARNILLKYNISRVIVLKNKESKKPVGIVTEKDIVRFLYAEFPKRNLDEIRLDGVTANQHLITIEGDTNVSDCAKLMLDNNLSSLVITKGNNEDSILSGIITKSDLLDAYAKSFGGNVAINEYMTKKVLTVKPDESVHIVLLIMADGNVSRVIVVRGNNNSKPVGIISSHDLLPASTLLTADKSKPPYTQHWAKGRDIKYDKLENESTNSTAAYVGALPYGMKRIVLAEDIMRPNPIMVTDYADLVDAALIMRGNRISGLPVVDLNDKLVGIITKTDIIRAIADGK